MAGRKKKYEDKELLDYLASYFSSECHELAKNFSYPGFSEYLLAHEIEFSENALKHRAAVVQAVQKLKAGFSLESKAPDTDDSEDEQKKEPTSAAYKALQKNYKDLMNLFSEAFTKEVAHYLLAQEGLANSDDLKADPAFIEASIAKPDEDPFENPFAKRMAAFAKEALKKEAPKKEKGEEP